MRRMLSALIAVLSVSWMFFVPTSPAVATGGPTVTAGGEVLECYVNPSRHWPPTYRPNCNSTLPSFSYAADFRISGGSGSYTYSWSLTGSIPFYGCGPTDNVCLTQYVDGRGQDTVITATVTIVQGAYSATLTTRASALAACPGPTGVEYC